MAFKGRTASKDCARRKFLGVCDTSACHYSHKNVPLQDHEKFEEYVIIPDNVSVPLALGKRYCNLKPVYKFRVIATSVKGLNKVVTMLKTILAQQRPLGDMWCYLHPEGYAAAERVEIREYCGRKPTQFFGAKRKGVMYEVYISKPCVAPPTIDTDSLREDIHESTPVDSDSSHGSWSSPGAASETPLSPERVPTPEPVDESPKKLPPSNSYCRSFQVLQDYKGHMKKELGKSLDLFLRDQGQSGGQKMLKLEARFGKVLWSHLPEGIMPQLTDDPSISDKEFVDFALSNPRYARTFNTDVKSEKAKLLGRELRAITEVRVQPTFETLNLKLSVGPRDADTKEKMDVRLNFGAKKAGVVEVRMNERKVAVFDVCCLHRQHDMRLSLQEFQVVHEGMPYTNIVEKLVKTIKIPNPGEIQLDPHTDEWDVNFIRWKRKTPYIVDDKYLVIISSVWEDSPDSAARRGYMMRMQEGGQHCEVEFHSLSWECSLGKAAHPTPEECLSLYMAEPSVDPALAASLPHSWTKETILQDYSEVVDNVEIINEFLGPDRVGNLVQCT